VFGNWRLSSHACSRHGWRSWVIPAVVLPDHGGHGSIVGTASDPSGAVVSGAKALEKMQPAKQAFAPENLAAAYAAIGDRDRAFYWLEQGYEHREMVSHDWGLYILKVDPLLAPLRSDPRFGEFLRRVGLQH
jgi:hypothetical protein